MSPLQVEFEVANVLVTLRVIAYDACRSRLARVVFILLLEENLCFHWLLTATAATNPRIHF